MAESCEARQTNTGQAVGVTLSDVPVERGKSFAAPSKWRASRSPALPCAVYCSPPTASLFERQPRIVGDASWRLNELIGAKVDSPTITGLLFSLRIRRLSATV